MVQPVSVVLVDDTGELEIGILATMKEAHNLQQKEYGLLLLSVAHFSRIDTHVERRFSPWMNSDIRSCVSRT